MKSINLFYKKKYSHKLQQESDPTFALLSCIDEYVESIQDELLSIPIVTDVQIVTGMYDMVVTMKSNSSEEIKQTITNKIRSIEGIRTSLILFGTNYMNK